MSDVEERRRRENSAERTDTRPGPQGRSVRSSDEQAAASPHRRKRRKLHSLFGHFYRFRRALQGVEKGRRDGCAPSGDKRRGESRRAQWARPTLRPFFNNLLVKPREASKIFPAQPAREICLCFPQ